MATVGARHTPEDRSDALARARLRAALVPDLLIEARRIVSTVIAGWHGRRKRGIGETFWQFRPYVAGETLAKIDWRRSARSDAEFVRQLVEQQAFNSLSFDHRAGSLDDAFGADFRRIGHVTRVPGGCS